MNDKLRKKKNVSSKAVVFWSAMGVLLLVLITLLVVRIAQTREVSSYKNVEMISGQEMFAQEESTYYVLFFDFEDTKENESFNGGMYKYLTYYRDNLKATKLYGMDSNATENAKCYTTSTEKITGAKEFPNYLNNDSSTVLKVKETSLPLLLIIEDGEVSSHKSGESEILSYLRGIMNN